MNSSDDLSLILQGWQPEAAVPRDFNRGVWSRLEAAEVGKAFLSSEIAKFFSSFARPRVAASTAMLALFVGLFLGGIEAHSSQQERYLQSLNPYSLHHHDR